MIKATKAIEVFLEQRFGRIQAQALVFGRARVVRGDIQFMDVKMMSELVERYRARVRVCIRGYRIWQSAHDTLKDDVARLYSLAEGALLHRGVSDAVSLWYFAHKDYHAMRRAYLYKCLGPRVRVAWGRAANKQAA